MGVRINDLNADLAVVRHGGPPLLGLNPALRSVRTTPEGCPPFPYVDSRGYYVIGSFDSVGTYLYVPYIVRALHLHDARDGLRVLYVMLFATALLWYPLVFYRLFDSTAAALVAPVVLAIGVARFAYTDLYWISAWTIVALIPLILLAVKAWTRTSLLLLVAAMLGASFAESIRVSIGTPILVCAILAMLFGVRGWRRRLVATVLLVIAYVSIAPAAMSA